MKRGKDEEKVMGPMFPRLHVNDREKKGGPRAPPRNKMALYEQFSIPSQKFNPNSSSSHTVAHSSHGNCPEKVSKNHVSRSYTCNQSNRANSDTLLARLEQRKEVNEDDFCASIHSKIGQSNDRTPGSFEGKKLASVGSRNLGCLAAVLNDGDKNPKRFGSPLVDMRRDVGNEGVAGSLYNDIEHGGSLLNSTSTCMRDMDNGNTLVPRRWFHSMANQTSPLEATNDSEYHDSRTCRLIQKENLDGSDDVSKVSVVENLSSLEVSPDDVVGILGQKHFWKARREIANQQRVFAVQVFELHRLIKVQQLIAESPDRLIEDGAFIGNFPSKRSICKNISVEVVVEPPQRNLKRQVDSEKLNNKLECSSENALEKTSFSSLKNGNHLSNCTPFSGNPPHPNVAAKYGTGPWCFDQSPGHQWLIPVMSPSEGLVYKPYPGPGFPGTMYGQCGPFGQVPHGSTFMNPAYAIPAPHQVIGVSPFIPASHHAYFSANGMPVTNQALSGSDVDKVNRFPSHGSHGQNCHSSVEGANLITHNQSSSSLPLQRNGATVHVKKLQVSKEREVRRSTASSHSEMTQGIRTGKISEERDKHSLSLNADPLAPEGVLQSLQTSQQTQVIKVVPHNARSATESAARIFQSIQEERNSMI